MSETKPEKSPQNQTSPFYNIQLFFNQLLNRFINRKWKSYLYTILRHPTEAKILMLSSDNCWFLPDVCVNDDLECDDIPVIKKEFEQKLGISVNILYCANNNYDESKLISYGVYVLEQK